MANNRFNMQVTPKGYKAGGRIKKMGGGMMKRPMYKKGSEVKGKDFMSSSMKDARSVAGKSGGADSGKTGEARSKAGVQEVRIKKGIKKFGKKVKDIATLKKFHDFAEKQYIKSLKEGKTNRGTDEPRRFKAMGGSLKSVPAGNKGLKKLPTEVRNKMGFMKKGGVVSDTKKKQFKANKAGQKVTNKKAMKVAKNYLNIAVPAVGAAEVGKKIARKFKGDK